jgi:hypothetical protein
MRIDGAGNVLIQNSDARLRGGDTTGRFIVSNSDTTSYITANGSANASPNTLSLITNTEIKMHTGASYIERMRIDSAGNLLVGQSSAYTGAGVTISGDGVVQAERNNVSGVFNRTGTDGDIVQFRKDGAPVGSIGTKSADLCIGTDDTGIRFGDGGNAVIPHNMTTNTTTDGIISFGTASERFKDLYLSGGVYLGGTGAANKLDDYEEGTWTPTLGGGATATGMTGKYTKVGNLVTAYLILENSTISGTPDYIVSGLPFTSAANRTALSVTYLKTFNTACESLGGFVGGNSTSMEFLGMVQGGSWLAANLTAGAGRYVYATAVYQTS